MKLEKTEFIALLAFALSLSTQAGSPENSSAIFTESSTYELDSELNDFQNSDVTTDYSDFQNEPEFLDIDNIEINARSYGATITSYN